MPKIKPTPDDDRGRPLSDRGREVYTTRLTGVDATTGVDIVLPVDIKEVAFHYEGATVVAKRTGTVAGSTEAYLTSDGWTEVLPVVKLANATVWNIKAPTGTTNVSVVAWR